MLNGKEIHLMGIGGIGMSGLAHILRERGHTVTGCDATCGFSQQRLQQQGIPVAIGHNPQHLRREVGLLVYSSAISPEEPERLEAETFGIPQMSRGQLLAELTHHHQLIGVAGAHGKTTTSGMTAQLLIEAGWDPTVVVGGYMLALGSNARYGQGRYVVAETDESDGSFLLLHPAIALVTNLDREHLNYYHSFERLIAAFRQFVEQIQPGGWLIRCADDPLVWSELSHARQLSYGLHERADVQASHIVPSGWGSEFAVAYRGRLLGQFRLRVPGTHNVVNALGVISVGLVLEIPVGVMQEALWAFRGTARRFQRLELPNDIWFVDDYAHHPSEIRATLAADPFRYRHRVAVFQPHRYSRTHLLEQEFMGCFDHADGVIVTDVYSAFESPIPGVSGERMAMLLKAHGHPCVRYVPRQELQDYLTHFIQPQDTVFFLGAGDITKVCHGLASELREDARTIG